VAKDIEDFERIQRTELLRVPRLARIQSSFAIREIVDIAVPPGGFRPGDQSRPKVEILRRGGIRLRPPDAVLGFLLSDTSASQE
jgi:hypothetical protein